jgi:hypothetical protein
LALVFVLWLAAVVPGRATTLTASLDRDTISLGESATLSLTVAGGEPAEVPRPPTVPNLEFQYGGAANQVHVINGQVNSAVIYNFTVVPRQPGDYTIPAFAVAVGAERLVTSPVTLKVLPGVELAFLRLVLPRKEVYVGETFTAQLQIYLANRVQRYGQPQLSAFPADGFNVGKMILGERRAVQVGNTPYTVIPVEIALRAIKAGPLTLGPATLNIVVELPSANNRPRGPFDAFFGNGNEQRQLSLATEPEPVQARFLPRENAPANFNGAIGNYTLAVSAGPTNVTVGDPITVKVQISGRGWLVSLALPEQADWSDF